VVVANIVDGIVKNWVHAVSNAASRCVTWTARTLAASSSNNNKVYPAALPTPSKSASIPGDDAEKETHDRKLEPRETKSPSSKEINKMNKSSESTLPSQRPVVTGNSFVTMDPERNDKVLPSNMVHRLGLNRGVIPMSLNLSKSKPRFTDGKAF
jgi:hypothetical protein